MVLLDVGEMGAPEFQYILIFLNLASHEILTNVGGVDDSLADTSGTRANPLKGSPRVVWPLPHHVGRHPFHGIWH